MAGAGDGADDLEGMDLHAKKEYIHMLQAQRERRAEYTERLQEKLKALNNELAARKEEAERNKKELNKLQAEVREEGNKGRELATAEQAKERERSVEKVRHIMEELLAEYTVSTDQRNELGIRVYDQTKLLVVRSNQEKEEEANYIDTVLITFLYPNSELKYNLSYRVSKYTTAQKLRVDACQFWGVSEVEYILRTKDNVKLHDDLNIQNSFKSDEPAHLFLVQKTPKNSAPSTEELAAIQPKKGPNKNPGAKKAKDDNGDANRNSNPSNMDFEGSLKKVPGLHAFMTQRDRNVTAHLMRIKLRSICVYFAFCIATLISYQMLRVGIEEYNLREGQIKPMTSSWIDEARGVIVSEFQHIRSEELFWEWLTYTVPRETLNQSSNLRMYNYLPGKIQVKMQQVALPSREACGPGVSVPEGDVCFWEKYNEKTAGTEDLVNITDYWQDFNTTVNRTAQDPGVNITIKGKIGTQGRTFEQPWKYLPSDTLLKQGVGKSAGYYSAYDASGYVVSYDLQYATLSDTYAAFQEDMTFFKDSGWVTPRLRNVIVYFNAYNGNYDMWTAHKYNFQMSPSGVGYPTAELQLLRPVTFMNTGGTAIFIADLVRAGLVLCICPYQVIWEIRYERSLKPPGRAWHYLLSPGGLCDILVFLMFTATFVLRYVVTSQLLQPTADLVKKIQDVPYFLVEEAWIFKTHSIVEAFTLMVAAYRLVRLLRINRHMYIIATTLNAGLVSFMQFLVVFLPIMIGCVCVAHATWQAYFSTFNSVWSSYSSTLMELFGSKDVITHETNRPFTLVYTYAFFILSVLVFSNSWVALLVQDYQTIRVQSGYKPSHYNWIEYQYAKWSLWSPIFHFYLTYLRPNIRQPAGTKEEDD